MSRAGIKAASLISQYEIDTPSTLIDHLEDFCFELGTIIQRKPLDGFEAKITAKNGKGIITINSNETREERVRFSIGHELGHFLLHCGEIPEFNCSKKDMNEWFGQQKSLNMEAEANEFSVELLMPRALVKPIIKPQVPNISVVEKLAQDFKMSLSATVMRYVELSEEPVAVMFYTKAKGTRNFKCSKYFEKQDYKFHLGLLDKESLASDAVNGRGQDRMSSVAASAWLDVPHWLEESLIYEQTRYFPQFDMGFSLLWMKSGKIIRN